MGYKIGKYKNDATPHRGWFIGSFMDEEATKTSDVEIKYWEMPIGITEHQTKVSSTYEVCIFISGRSRGMIDNQEHIFEAGDYIAIPPGIASNPVIEILEPVMGLTIKAPSDPGAKTVIGDHS